MCVSNIHSGMTHINVTVSQLSAIPVDLGVVAGPEKNIICDLYYSFRVFLFSKM